MAVANGESKKKRHRWFEEFLLSLNPIKLYSTGDIVSEWEENEQILKKIQEKHDKNPKGAQPALSRYMPERYKMFTKSSSKPNPEATHIYQPVKTETYKQTGHEQQIYLGAQYAWVAADYLGLEQPRPLKEVLELYRKALDEAAPPKPAKTNAGVAVGNSREVVHSSNSTNSPVEVFVDNSLTSKPLDGDLGQVDQADKRPTRKRSLRKRFRRRRGAIGFSLSILSFVFCLGVAGNLYFSNSKAELQELNKAHQNGTLSELHKKVDGLEGNKTVAQKYIQAWGTANDPAKSIEDLQLAVEPLLNHENTGWQAKGYHALGVANFKRGNLEEALHQYKQAELLLEGRTNQRSDLKQTHLQIARCYFFLKDQENLMDYIKKAELVNTKNHNALVLHYKSRYWFLRGDIDKSIDFSEESLEIATVNIERNLLGAINANLGLLNITKGDLNKGYRYLKTAQVEALKRNDSKLSQELVEYERLWAEKMNLPLSRNFVSKEQFSFSEERYYTDFFLELARRMSR